jgi:hypothetical protein
LLALWRMCFASNTRQEGRDGDILKIEFKLNADVAFLHCGGSRNSEE